MKLSRDLNGGIKNLVKFARDNNGARDPKFSRQRGFLFIIFL